MDDIPVAAVDDTPRVLHGSWMWARQSEENKAEFVKDHKLGRGRLGETREGEFWPGVTPSTLGWGHFPMEGVQSQGHNSR